MSRSGDMFWEFVDWSCSLSLSLWCITCPGECKSQQLFKIDLFGNLLNPYKFGLCIQIYIDCWYQCCYSNLHTGMIPKSANKSRKLHLNMAVKLLFADSLLLPCPLFWVFQRRLLALKEIKQLQPAMKVMNV